MKTLFSLLLCILTFSVFSQPYVISARCGNCKRAVPVTSRVGEKCPYCGVFWGSENKSTTYKYVRPTPQPHYGPAPKANSTPLPATPRAKTEPAKVVVSPTEYGNRKMSVGFALLGESGSWFGLPVRYFLKPNMALDAGLFYAPSLWHDDYEGELILLNGGVLSAGATFFEQKFYKERKNKIKRNGCFIRAGRSFGQSRNVFLIGGWSNEGFRRSNRNQSFLFELGCGLSKLDKEYYSSDNSTHFTASAKLQWNLFTGSHWGR